MSLWEFLHTSAQIFFSTDKSKDSDKKVSRRRDMKEKSARLENVNVHQKAWKNDAKVYV